MRVGSRGPSAALTPGKRKVLIVDDHPIVRQGLRLMIDEEPDLKVCGEAQSEREAALRAQHPDCIVMSARRPADVAKLHAAIVAFFRRDRVEAELLVPWSAQQLRGEIFAQCEVLDERAGDEGALFRVRAEPQTLERLRGQLAGAKPR